MTPKLLTQQFLALPKLPDYSVIRKGVDFTPICSDARYCDYSVAKAVGFPEILISYFVEGYGFVFPCVSFDAETCLVLVSKNPISRYYALWSQVAEDQGAFYGFQYFKNFKPGTPIVLVEGYFDQKAFSHLIQYPYTLATLTSSLSGRQLNLLKHLTRSIYLAFDNDGPGKDGTEQARKLLTREGFSVGVLEYPLPDPGEAFERNMEGFINSTSWIRSGLNP